MWLIAVDMSFFTTLGKIQFKFSINIKILLFAYYFRQWVYQISSFLN